MAGRARPLNGSDSTEAWAPRPFRVLVCDRYDEDDRRWITVPLAVGPHDASSQVRLEHPGVSVLHAEEVAA
jgi:hypothetical protein